MLIPLLCGLVLAFSVCETSGEGVGVEEIELRIAGGHETDPRDHGRPVVLIAHGLGVAPEVFRAAFSNVKPAAGGREPNPEQVRQNKAALLRALSPHGVTNELLDKVSDFYRYQPGRGHLWRVSPARARIKLKNGRVEAIVITDHGTGYSSPPSVSVPGHPEIKLAPTLRFDRDLTKNGSISAITAERKLMGLQKGSSSILKLSYWFEDELNDSI
jgi:hypothetical protein